MFAKEKKVLFIAVHHAFLEFFIAENLGGDNFVTSRIFGFVQSFVGHV